MKRVDETRHYTCPPYTPARAATGMGYKAKHVNICVYMYPRRGCAFGALVVADSLEPAMVRTLRHCGFMICETRHIGNSRPGLVSVAVTRALRLCVCLSTGIVALRFVQVLTSEKSSRERGEI